MGSVVGSAASARWLDFHSGKTHRVSGAKAGTDVYPVRGRRGAVGVVAEPPAESLPDGGESASERQGGDDRVPASALGGYGSERPEGESLGLRLGEVRHGPVAGSGESGNIRMGSAWRTSGGFAVFLCVKDAGKPCAFQVPKPVSGQTCPCKPMKGEWICRSRFMLDKGRFAPMGARPFGQQSSSERGRLAPPGARASLRRRSRQDANLACAPGSAGVPFIAKRTDRARRLRPWERGSPARRAAPPQRRRFSGRIGRGGAKARARASEERERKTCQASSPDRL